MEIVKNVGGNILYKNKIIININVFNNKMIVSLIINILNV